MKSDEETEHLINKLAEAKRRGTESFYLSAVENEIRRGISESDDSERLSLLYQKTIGVNPHDRE